MIQNRYLRIQHPLESLANIKACENIPSPKTPPQTQYAYAANIPYLYESLEIGEAVNDRGRVKDYLNLNRRYLEEGENLLVKAIQHRLARS